MSTCRRLGNVLVATVVACGIGVAANAASVNPRPIAFSDAALQGVFDGISVAGGGSAGDISAIGGQNGAAIFNSDGSGGAIASFIVEIAGNASTNSFGIYKFGSPAVLGEIFSGTDTAGSQKTVTFFDATFGNKIRITDNIGGAPPIEIPGFGNTFGFYMKDSSVSSGPKTFFSEDSLNPGGDPQALIYQGTGTNIKLPGFAQGLFTADEFIVAFEDVVFASSDESFNDLVVLIESITPVPVPVPAAAWMGLATLAGLGLVRRIRGKLTA